MKKLILLILLLATIALCDYLTGTEPKNKTAAEPVKPVIINFRTEKPLAQ